MKVSLQWISKYVDLSGISVAQIEAALPMIGLEVESVSAAGLVPLEKVVVGETATLELDPHQVDIVALAQKTSSLSLALRSLQDAGELSPPTTEGGMTLVRYGVTSKGVKP